jgi:hypothetical protein
MDSRIIGMLLTKYLFYAALSRSDVPRESRVPFHLYLDEFQNFVGADVTEMLAESRKYGLYLTLANQTLSQLVSGQQRETLDAVLGNVATRLFLRVGQSEAAALEADFAPYFDARTLRQLPDRHVLCRLQISNQPTLPIVFETRPITATPEDASAERSRAWAAANFNGMSAVKPASQQSLSPLAEETPSTPAAPLKPPPQAHVPSKSTSVSADTRRWMATLQRPPHEV